MQVQLESWLSDGSVSVIAKHIVSSAVFGYDVELKHIYNALRYAFTLDETII